MSKTNKRDFYDYGKVCAHYDCSDAHCRVADSFRVCKQCKFHCSFNAYINPDGICEHCNQKNKKQSLKGNCVSCDAPVPVFDSPEEDTYHMKWCNQRKTKWVGCPICGQSDTRAERQGEVQENLWQYFCTNAACRSNGGNYDEKLVLVKQQRKDWKNSCEGMSKEFEKTEERYKDAVKDWQKRTADLVNDVVKLQNQSDYWKQQALKSFERGILLKEQRNGSNRNYIQQKMRIFQKVRN